MIFASVPVLQPPDQMTDTWPSWEGCGPELLVVDNTADGAWDPLAREYGWSYAGFGRNLAVSASWNVARANILAHEGQPHDLLLLFSASLHFDDGLPAVLDQIAAAANWKGCQTQYGPHCLAYSRRLLELAGTWDENLPNYYGDNDYFYRLILEGWLLAQPDPFPQIDINAPVPEDGRAVNRTGLITNMSAAGEYYRARWGGPPSEETFTSPFDSGLPPSWWSPAWRPHLDHFDPWESRYR